MRIAQIVASLEARHGGPSRSVLGVATGLAHLGHDVELLTTEPGPEIIEHPVPGLTLRRFARRGAAGLAGADGLRRYLRGAYFDVLHAHALWQRPLHYAAVAAGRCNRPLVISPRGMMAPWAWRHHRWKKWLAAHLVHPGAFAQAAGWHATSEDEAADIRRLGFGQPICVAPNGVDVPTAADLTVAANHWRASAPVVASSKVALFYSRFHPKKRVVELIDLWLRIAPPDWILLVVGIPEAYTVEELASRARAAGAADRVLVFDGTTTPPPYAVATIFVLPTHSENFGLTIAEALAHGVPVLTTDGAPWRRLNEIGGGSCVPWAEWPAALAAMLSIPTSELAAQGAAGRAWMQREFGWPAAVFRLETFYRTLLAAT